MSATETRFLRIKDVLDRVPVSRPTIYRLIKKREFPEPLSIGSSSLWVEAEIEQWMNDKIKARNG